MSRTSLVWIGAVAVTAVVVFVLTRNWVESAAPPSASPTVSLATAITTPSPTASQASTPTPTPTPTAGLTPAAPATTRPPRATGAPRLAYAAFLLRINDDRATFGTLNSALSSAAQAQDPDAVRRAAVDILDFVDSERDWLRDNPPADCYAEAHASAGAVLDAYGSAADAFISWAASGGGIAGLGALSKAADAAQAAGDALSSFGHVLDATRCPA
jgi:hypothetical protein